MIECEMFLYIWVCLLIIFYFRKDLNNPNFDKEIQVVIVLIILLSIDLNPINNNKKVLFSLVLVSMNNLFLWLLLLHYYLDFRSVIFSFHVAIKKQINFHQTWTMNKRILIYTYNAHTHTLLFNVCIWKCACLSFISLGF